MMYNPMAFWGQRDLIPQIVVDYGAKNPGYTTVTYTLEGKLLSASVAPVTGSGYSETSPLTRICQDFINAESVNQNFYSIPNAQAGYYGPYSFTQPYFCSTTSKDGLSEFGPIEAWYLDISNQLSLSQTMYIQYVNKDGQLTRDTIPNGQTKRILTQTYPIGTRDVFAPSNRFLTFVTPVEKYLGNVTPYPYKDVAVNYKIQNEGDYDIYYHITGSSGADTNIGMLKQSTTTPTGSIVTSFNIPLRRGSNNVDSYFTIDTVITSSLYNVKKCTDNTTASVSLVAGLPIYSNGTILNLTGSTFISGCYEVTQKITSSVQYENLNVVNSYPNCTWCQNDVRFYNVSMLGGGNIGAGYSMSYIDFNGASRTLSLSTFGNIFKFLARSGSVSTTYGGSTTITELSPNPTTRTNYTVSAGGGFSTSRIFSYQSGSGEVVQIFSSGDFASSSYCAISSSLIQSWPTNGTFPYSIVTGSAC